MLPEAGASIAAADYAGATKLHMATCWGNASIVRFLLGEGAAICATDRQGRTALHYAAMRSDCRGRVVKALIQAGSDVDAKDKEP